MKRIILISILVFFAFLVPSTEIAFAEGGIAWDPQGMPVSEAPGEQVNIRMVPDGSGGAIIVWQDHRVGEADIYAQRIDENGIAQWTTYGVAVCTAPMDQINPVIVGDGEGGAIIAWEDYQFGYWNIYALRIRNDTGGPYTGWPSTGVVLSPTTYDQFLPDIVSDGSNGAIIVWQEFSGSQYSIYAHGISGDGSNMWAGSVVVSSGTTTFQGYPKVIKSDSNNVIITWEDQRNVSKDIYAQRVSISTGTVEWGPYGKPVSEANDNQLKPEIVSDGSGGAIITWTDWRPSTIPPDIYAQRIDFSGTQVWTNNGIPVCEEINGQYNPVITNHFIGVAIEGAIIAWEDMRSGDVDIYAGRVDLNGYVDGSEMPFATGSGPQEYPRLVSDSQGGGIIGTAVEYEGSSSKIFANKRDEYGQLVWSSYPGVLVCEGTEIDYDYQMVNDGYGGAIIAWVGFGDSGNFDIFAQRVTDDTVMWISVPISGRVTRSDGEEPITGVEVEALINDEVVSSDFTDTDGYYELTVVAGSTYTVRATWMENDIESSVSMKAFAPSYYFDFTLEIYYELGTIAGNVSGVEQKYVASFSLPESKRISNSGLQKILSPGNGIAFVELEQRGKVIVKVPVEMEGDYSIPNLLPGRFIARAYNGTIYSNPRTVNLKEGETFKVNFVFGTIPKETVFNYPNPAKSGSTTIRYYCGYSDPEAEIKIYNIAGELVREVGDSEINRDGTDPRIYRFLWDCKNDSGKEVASGIYIYIVEVKEKSSGATKKVVKRLAVIR